MNTRHLVRVAAKAVFAALDPLFGPFTGPRILIYHQVGVSFGREMEVSTDTFRRQLDWMQAHGQIVSLEEAIERRDEPEADKLFVLTFDDGFEDVYSNAFPLLRERYLPFTLYLTTNPIEKGEPLDPRYPEAKPLTWHQIKEILSSGLVMLGAHTHTHADLTAADAETIAGELDTSNGLIEQHTGVRPRHFTYPWGWWSPTADPLVRGRYDSATIGGGGPFTADADLYRIPRIPIQKSDRMVFFRRKMKTGLRGEDWLRRRLRARTGMPEDSRTFLFLINSLNPGGAERSLVELVPAFRRAGFDVVIACLANTSQGTLVEEAREAGAEVVTLQASGWFGWLREIRRLLRRLRPRVLHTTLFEANMVGRLAAIGTGVPVAVSLVNTSYDPVRMQVDPNVKRWKLRILQAVDGWTARRFVDRFHAITEAVREAAVRDLRLDPAKVTVIPRSRNPERLGERSPERRAEVRARLGIPQEAFVALNVGRQEYQKGQRYLLEAAAELREEDPDLMVLIAGREGNATEDLQTLHRELRLGESVRFLGHRDDIGDLLAAADVFVFPSIYEGLGGALLEAMTMGLPIVASDIPAVREVLATARDAILVPPRPSQTLAAGLKRSRVSGPRGVGQVLRSPRFEVAGSMVAWLGGDLIPASGTNAEVRR